MREIHNLLVPGREHVNVVCICWFLLPIVLLFSGISWCVGKIIGCFRKEDPSL